MSQIPRGARLLIVAAAVATFSCGGGGRDLRKTYPVKGTLQIDGKPAAAGIVVNLIPQFTETDKTPIHPVGETDAAGNFQITTYNTNDGAPEGDYVATIEWKTRVGLSPHFSGDLFDGLFAKVETNKAKPEFNVKVAKGGSTVDLKVTLTPEQKKKVDEGLKKAKAGSL